MRAGTRRFAALVVTALVVGTIGCSSDDDSAVAITMGENGLVVTGGSVDAGIMCPGGVPHHIGYLELDGSPLAPDEGFERLVEGLWDDPLDEVADFLAVHQLTCADGSGSFTVVVEDRNGGAWSVDEGIGAYTDLRGSGTVEVERRPADHPDGPPGGVPSATRLTGVIELAD